MPPSLPAGLYPQPYRYKIPGSTEAAKVAAWRAKAEALLTRYPELVGYLAGVLPHGFSAEFTADKWELWHAMAEGIGLAAGVAFGISDPADSAARGARIGLVAARPGCVLVEIDAEGPLWEKDGVAVAADTLCLAIHDKAPRARLYNQSWPVPTYHSRYPFLAFAKHCVAFSEQRYYNDWTGLDRYRRNEAWFCESWGTEEKVILAPANAVRPHAPTVQGYGWSDIVPSAVDCFCKYDDVAVAVWSEWWPEDSFWLAARCVAALHARGYRGPSAVWDFQTDTAPLVIDGICGPATRAALGVT